MDRLFEVSVNKIKRTKLQFKRHMVNKNIWSNRLIGILGARGAGKTTLMLQYLKENYGLSNSALYVSLDNLYFTGNTLLGLAERFVKEGGVHLFIDEVHKYPNWAIEIKNIYDTYDELKVVFTGSSILQMHKGEADLSRRAVVWQLPGLSFREFVELEYNLKYPAYTLSELLIHHVEIAGTICEKTRPIALFNQYLKYGYYPYFTESKEYYKSKLQSTIGAILETDVPSIYNVDYYTVNKLKKLLYILAQNVPYQPNIATLAESLGSIRGTVLLYLDYLERACLISQLRSQSQGNSILTKPDKIYLNNTNIAYAISEVSPNLGNLRETFFLNQLKAYNEVHYTKTGDFLVNREYTFEIGGRSKSDQQIKNAVNGYVASDDIEFGYKNTIPLWLFGFLY
jgi:predicted AAA+ superfamily ATPase